MIPSLLSFTIAFILVLFIQPSIVQIAIAKKFDHPADEKLPGIPQLTLGGIAIFMATILASIGSIQNENFPVLNALIAAMVVLLFSGMLLDCRLRYKYLRNVAKIIAAVILVTLGNFGPSLSKYTQYEWISPVIQVIGVVAFMLLYHHITQKRNRYLIVSSIIGSTLFGFFFLIMHEESFSIIAFALSGSLSAMIGFYIYSIRIKKPITRLGHTGIYMIAIILAAFCIKLAEMMISWE